MSNHVVHYQGQSYPISDTVYERLLGFAPEVAAGEMSAQDAKYSALRRSGYEVLTPEGFCIHGSKNCYPCGQRDPESRFER